MEAMASTALCAETLDLQKVALHGRLEVPLNVFGNFVHQAQVDFLHLAAFLADEVVMVFVFDPLTDEVAELPVFVCRRHQNSATREIFQYPINGGQPDTLEPFVQFRLHLKWIKNGCAFQEQFDGGPHLGRDAMTIFLQSGNVSINRHETMILSMLLAGSVKCKSLLSNLKVVGEP